MGFDIECIINIQTYPGEYFCPVCRTLVYPNEAFQSQCSHLYCKPCLAHVANGSKACPYDGYLVTESDSKPLIDSDRTLVEKIGKVKVHCLFFRSGCTWEGTLSDCTSHCSECSFGSSAVICNRCGIQIVHRQVHDHAQSCTGVYEAKQATGGVPVATSSGTALSTATANVNHTTAQSGQPLSQAQNTQNVAVNLQPGQNANQQPIANPQAVSVQTTEHWYQQQYQQYYQQYAGYDPYQQPHQQYYSFQQYQQNPLHVHGQPQSHAYTQPSAQPQPQTQPQLQPHPLPQSQPQPQQQLQSMPQPQPQPQSHSHHQPQIQSYPVPQTQQQPQFQPPAHGQAQSQPPMLSQIPIQVQVPSQGQPQLRAPNQTFPPNYQVNPQQQPPLLMRPQAQIPPQIPPPPPHSQPNQLPPTVQAISMQPAVQHPQLTLFFQPPLQIHHSHASQTYTQPQFQNQISNQSHLQIQPQASQYQNQYLQVYPPPLNQPTVPAVQPQPPHPPASSVTGHHSYQQPQPAHQMHSGVLDQPPINLRPTSGSLHPVKVHGQVPHQPAVMRPPPSHDSFPPQPPSAYLLPQSQVSGVPPAHQKFSTHAQPSNHLPQHGTVMQPVQQTVPQQIAQQQPFVTPVKGQFQQQGHFQQQQPLQPELRPYGRPQQSQNYDRKPMMSNEGMHHQNYPQSSGCFGAVVHAVPAQLGSTRIPANPNSIESAVLEKEDSFSSKSATVPDARVPGQGLAEKEVLGTDVEPLKEEAIWNDKLGPHETVVTRVKDEVGESAIEKLSCGISIEAKTTEGSVSKEKSHSVADSNFPQQVEDLESRKEAVVAGLSTDIEKVPKNPVSKPEAQAKEQFSSTLRPQGLGTLPHPGQSLPLPVSTSHIGRAPGYFGPPPGGFEADPRGGMGNASQIRPESQSGLQNHVGPNDGVMSKHQSSSYMSGSVESGPHRQISGHEPSVWRTNGETDSNFGLREYLNPYPVEPFRPLGQGSVTLDKSQPGSSYDTGGKLNSGLDPNSRLLPPHRASVGQGNSDVFGPGPESGRYNAKHFPTRSPDGEYLGISPHEFGGPSRFRQGSAAFDDINAREVHRFGEGSRPFNLPSDPVGNPFHDSRFPPMLGHPRRGDSGGQHNLRFGEHMTRPLHNHIKSDDTFGKDGPVPLGRVDFSGPGYLPGHFMSEAAGPGIFSGHPHAGELGGPGNFNHRIPFGESVRGDRPSIPPYGGEPGIRGNYPLQGFPNSGSFAGEVNSFDQSRKRKPFNMGWCRICMFDCETVERLEMHSQTREHQKMALDMVKTIKQRNKKKQRTSAGHMGYDGGSRSKKVGTNDRGSKP